MVLKRVGVASAAKMTGALYAGGGLLVGAIFACIALVGAGAAESLSGSSNGMTGMFGALFGVSAIVILPIVYGIMGFVGGAIFAWLYNLVAGMTGGIELDLQ